MKSSVSFFLSSMARLNRKGIELSVNFLVMVILAIVLFGLGIIFARNLFNSSTALVSTSQDQLDAAIENMYCTANEIVCINLNSKTLPRGTAKVFGVNVVNAYQDGEFRATIVNTKYIALDNSVTDLRTAPDDQKLQILPEDASFSLGKNKDQRTGFLIRP